MKPNGIQSNKTGYIKAITWIVIAVVVKFSGSYIFDGTIASAEDLAAQNEAEKMRMMVDVMASLIAVIGVILLLKAGYDKRKSV